MTKPDSSAVALDVPARDTTQPEVVRSLTAVDSEPGAVHWPDTQAQPESHGCCGAPCSGSGGCRSDRVTG